MVCNYIKLLLKKWYVYLSLIPVVQGFSISYFKTEIYLQQSVLWVFALISVFIACYSVWLDQKKENSRLQKTIKEHENKFSSFELTAVLKKIYVEPLKKECFVNQEIPQNSYPSDDFSVVFIGEIIGVYQET